MRFSFGVLSILVALSGCSLVRDLVGKGRSSLDEPADVVAPGQLLDGEAARLQDSLRPKLLWLSTHGPKKFAATRIAFRAGVDSTEPSMLLEIDVDEPDRLNAHRQTPTDLARSEARRILSLRPWAKEASASKVAQPLVLRVAFKSRDFLSAAGRFEDDTVSVRYLDSSVTWKGSPLRP